MFKETLRFTIVLFIIWSMVHVSFFYRALNGHEHQYFWPLHEEGSLASSYDFPELGVYVIIPAIILLIISQWQRKKELLGE